MALVLDPEHFRVKNLGESILDGLPYHGVDLLSRSQNYKSEPQSRLYRHRGNFTEVPLFVSVFSRVEDITWNHGLTFILMANSKKASGWIPFARVSSVCSKLTTKRPQTLLDGNRHRIKADCDKATALKYREAMISIGAKVAVERRAGSTAEGQSEHASSAVQAEAQPDPKPAFKPVIRRVPEVGEPAKFDSHSPGETPIEFESDAQESESQPDEAFSLAPVGALLGDQSDRAEPAPVPVPGFDVADAGEMIPNAPRNVTPLSPNTEHLSVETISSESTE